LALNKLELKEMIDAEMVENPVLEEIDETVPMLDEVAGREERMERGVEEHVVEEPAPAQGSFQRDRLRIVLPGLPGPRLSHTAGV
jgi:RNA polymerase sigma-54 factor